MTTNGLQGWSEHQLQAAFSQANAEIASLQNELRNSQEWRKAAQNALAAMYSPR